MGLGVKGFRREPFLGHHNKCGDCAGDLRDQGMVRVRVDWVEN